MTEISFYAPEYSKWKCYLSGRNTALEVIYIPIKDAEPNWFHRKMQEFCFGFKWVKE